MFHVKHHLPLSGAVSRETADPCRGWYTAIADGGLEGPGTIGGQEAAPRPDWANARPEGDIYVRCQRSAWIQSLVPQDLANS